MNTYALDLPQQILADGYCLPNVPLDKHSVLVTFSPDGFIQPSLLDYFRREFKIEFDSFQLFALPPKVRSGIHTDTAGELKHTWAINWVLNPKNSYMCWYSVKNPEATPKAYAPGGGSAGSELYQEEDVEVSQLAKVGPKPALVRVDVPHCVFSLSQEIRWCVSLRAMRAGLSWDDAVSLFTPLFAV